MTFGLPALILQNTLHEKLRIISQNRYCPKLNMIMINNTISGEDILFDLKKENTQARKRL